MNKDKCKQTWEILKVQYKPREKAIEETLKQSGDKKSLNKWKKKSYCEKIKIIDNLQSKGVFD